MKKKAKIVSFVKPNLVIPELIEENEFTKTFKYGEIELFLQKAFDDVKNEHCLICAIPIIKELNVGRIMYPIPFESEDLRNTGFTDFNAHTCDIFIQNLIAQIKENQKEQNIKN